MEPMNIQGMRWWSVAACAAVHAVLLGISFPPVGAWPLVFLAPIPLVIAAVRARSSLVLLAWVFAFQLVVWGAIQLWVREVSVAGWPAFAVYMACWSVLLAACLRLLGRSHMFGGVPLAVVVPVTWVALDYLRGSIVLGGYPWYLLGQPTIGWLPLAQIADLGGQELASLLPAAVAGVAADVLLPSRLQRFRRHGALIGVACLLVAVVAYGYLRIRPIEAGEPGPVVLVIQTNIPTSNKMAWSPEAKIRDVDGFARMTLDVLAELREKGIEPDLVAWPETMLPGPGLEENSVQAYESGGWFPGTYFRDLIMDLRGLAGVPLLIGSASYEGLVAPDSGVFTWDAHYNSVYFVNSDLPFARYDKINLTPFGERMPVISRFPWLEERLLDFGASGMSFALDESDEAVRFRLPLRTHGEQEDEISIATPICFEDTVPWVCRELVWGDGPGKQALLLVSLSNDGWFGDSLGGREMHLMAARFRAIENRVPLLRAVNTGVSALIDSSGRQQETVPAMTSGSLVAMPRLDRGWTVFAAIGQLAPAIMSIVLLLGIVLSLRGPKEESQAEVSS